MRFASLALVLALGVTAASAQPVIDGNLADSQYTLLDDNAGGATGGFGPDNNLNALYAFSTADSLYLGVAGSVSNGNRILVFLDTRAGGFNTTAFDRGTDLPGAVARLNTGITFDAGFNADFVVAIGTNDGQANTFVDLIELSATMTTKRFVGSADSEDVGAAPVFGNNAQTTAGFEVAIPRDELGTDGAAIEAFAFLSNDGGDDVTFLSNLFISPATSEPDNFGSGPIDFNARTPNPVSYTLENGDGDGTGVVTSSVAGYRLLAVPEMPMTIDALAQINLVAGGAGYTVGPGCTGNAGSNIFTTYNGDDTSGGYGAPASGAETVVPGQGFFWFFYTAEGRACSNGTATSTSMPLPLTLPASGAQPTGNATYTPPARTGGDGAYMVGNPFGVAFDIDGLAATFPAGRSAGTVLVQTNVQAYDPEFNSGAGGYVVITSDGGDDTAAGADDVSAWQGFFIEVDPNAGTPTFFFSDTFALDGFDGDEFYARTAAGDAAGEPIVKFQVSNGAVGDAAAVVQFHGDANVGWDRFDLSKLAPITDAFAQFGPVGFNRDGESVTKAVESRALASGAVTIPFAFTTSAAGGEFTITWPTLVLADGQTMSLRDVVTGQSVDLATAGALSFTHDAAAPAERFELTSSLLVSNETAVAAGVELSALSPNPTSGAARMTLSVSQSEAVTVQVFDALGRRVATVLDETVSGSRAITVPTAALAPGVYVVRVAGGSFAETRRLTVTR